MRVDSDGSGDVPIVIERKQTTINRVEIIKNIFNIVDPNQDLRTM